MSLPGDVARCRGTGSDEDGKWYWREGCADCQRRTSPPPNPERALYISPPQILVFECEYLIPPITAGRT